MTPQKENELLAQEYQLLQTVYENLGARALTVKTWSATFGATGIGLAYTSGIPLILWIVAISGAVFWLLEALLQAHQQAFMFRIKILEDHFQDGESRTAPFQINRYWMESFFRRGRVMSTLHRARFPHVMLPHVIMVLVGPALFFLQPPTEQPNPDRGRVVVER